ncbi:MAG: nucleotidyltransferase family protein [Actinomycetota bacterium]
MYITSDGTMQAGVSWAIILAAGNSTRMGICKAGLPWLDGKTLLGYQVQQWLSIGVIPVVVLGSHNTHRQQDCPPETLIVINPNSRTGNSSSIGVGLQQIPEFEVLVISAVDEPRPAWVYQKLLKIHQEREALITAPTYQEKMGHPLLFSKQLRSDLASIQKVSLGLQKFVEDWQEQIQKVEIGTPVVLMDINTPTRYEAGREIFSKFLKEENC